METTDGGAAKKSTRTDDHAHACSVAGRDHVGELGTVAALRGERVGHRLVVGPPLAALDMFRRRANYERGAEVNIRRTQQARRRPYLGRNHSRQGR